MASKTLHDWLMSIPLFSSCTTHSFIYHLTALSPCFSLDMPRLFLPQGLCTCYFLHLECSSPRSPHGWLPLVSQVPAQMSLIKTILSKMTPSPQCSSHTSPAWLCPKFLALSESIYLFTWCFLQYNVSSVKGDNLFCSGLRLELK